MHDEYGAVGIGDLDEPAIQNIQLEKLRSQQNFTLMPSEAGGFNIDRLLGEAETAHLDDDVWIGNEGNENEQTSNNRRRKRRQTSGINATATVEGAEIWNPFTILLVRKYLQVNKIEVFLSVLG